MYFDGNYNTTNHDSYTEVELSGDTYMWVENGDTIENYLIRTNQHAFEIQANDLTSYTLRNIGVDGPIAGHGNGILMTGVSGTANVEYCWFGDGGLGDWRDKHQRGTTNIQPTGIFTFSPHTGDLNVTDTYWGPFTDNTFYCENQGSSGNVHFTRTFVYGGCVAAYRLGGSGSHTMEDCHHANPGYHPVQGHSGQRSIWIRSSQNSSIDVSGDSQLACGGNGIISSGGPTNLYDTTQYCESSGNVNIIDTGVGTSPDPYVPDSVPSGPLDAATGGDEEDDDEEEEPVIVDYPAHGNGYFLRPEGGSEETSFIVRPDLYVEEGNTYEAEFWIEPGSDPYLGICLASQTVSWDNFSGHMALFRDNDTLFGTWQNGSVFEYQEGDAVPEGEIIRAQIDFRETSDNLILNVFDEDDDTLVSLTHPNEDYATGYPGFYQYNSDNKAIYSLRDVEPDDPDPEPPDDEPVDPALDPDDREIGAIWYRGDL